MGGGGSFPLDDFTIRIIVKIPKLCHFDRSLHVLSVAIEQQKMLCRVHDFMHDASLSVRRDDMSRLFDDVADEWLK